MMVFLISANIILTGLDFWLGLALLELGGTTYCLLAAIEFLMIGLLYYT
jgi:hypothetical protein